MKWLIYFCSLICIIPCLCKSLPALKATYVSLENKNKEADRAFIDWKIDTPFSLVSNELVTVLTPEVREFIVQESQLPFNEYISKDQLKHKVELVKNKLEKRFRLTLTHGEKSELEKLVTEVIVPEYVFQINHSEATELFDIYYNDLMVSLSRYSTPEGTLLKDWALSFLTSESQFIALSIIKRQTVEGKFFSELSDSEQTHILSSSSEVISRRFIENLAQVRQKYSFYQPPSLSMVLKKRINQFLFEKFAS